MESAVATIDRKYEILGKIKEGGMGAIYMVRHRLLGELRVIKVMKPQLESDAEMTERFAREARTAIKLRHSNIAQLYDFSIDETGTAFIVMEYIHGVDLRELQRRVGPPPLGVTLEVAVQSLQALGFLHRRGMVHRDISPDNLMLTRDQDGRAVVKLIDLGIVKVLEGADAGLTNTGMFIGKVRYASPEQFKSAEGSAALDQRSDLYSFGVLLYEMLTGGFPIAGSTNSALIAGHLFQQPVGFESSDPQGRVPGALRAIVMRLLEKEPDARYPTAEALIEALTPLQGAHPLRPEDVAACLPDHAEPQVTADGLESAQALLDRQFAGDRTPAPAPTQVATTPTRPLGQPVMETAPTASVRADGSPAAGPPAPSAAIPQPGPPAPAPAPAPPRRRGLIAALVAIGVIAIGAAIVVAVLLARGVSVFRAGETAGSTPAEAGAAAAGTLVIHAVPWAEVTRIVDESGTEVALGTGSVTPLALSLAPGTYTVTLRNPTSGATTNAAARVVPGQTSRLTSEISKVTPEKFLESMGW